MEIEILFFGQLTDKTGCSSFWMENPGNIEALSKILFQKYPKLETAKFTIALNNKIANVADLIPDNAKIALMPPFSGG
jgi:molybdopterin synthase sulfur carrier subunit